MGLDAPHLKVSSRPPAGGRKRPSSAPENQGTPQTANFLRYSQGHGTSPPPGSLMASMEPFEDDVVQRLARIVGETNTGFPGPEIGRILNQAGIPDPGEMTKWRRIYTALVDEQRRTLCGNCTVVFVTTAMRPQRWPNHDAFEEMRRQLNEVLAYEGLSIGRDGQMNKRSVARTHQEAGIARQLRDELSRRGGHSDVFKYCTQELVAEDCFGAVFEAVKGLNERIRARRRGLGPTGTSSSSKRSRDRFLSLRSTPSGQNQNATSSGGLPAS